MQREHELQEQRHVYYDQDLKIEAYQLYGIVQKFPNHFHEDYVIGFVEGGKRHLWCKNQEYNLTAGDLILFNPRDNHFCEPVNGELLDYRAVNINPEVMAQAIKEITGQETPVHFTQNVIFQSDITSSLGALYDAIISRAEKLEKEEMLYFLLEQVLQACETLEVTADIQETNSQIQALCAYMEADFAKSITLDELVSMTNFGKSYLLRCFTKQIGVSPYRYLQTVRLNRAKQYLEQGITPIDVANMSGFADQSHFTNFFKAYIGVSPKQYQRIFQDSDYFAGGRKACRND